MEKHSEEYQELLVETILDDWIDQYKQCKDCKKPTQKRYICSHCGSIDP